MSNCIVSGWIVHHCNRVDNTYSDTLAQTFYLCPVTLASLETDFYQCLAFGCDIRLSSDTLESSIAQSTEDMVAKQKHRLRRGKKLQLSQLLDKVKSMQPEWQKQAQSR